MKLIIDIPEEYLKTIKAIPDETSSLDMLLIKYGTPFDSVVEEIKAKCDDINEVAKGLNYVQCRTIQDSLADIMSVLYKHISRKENNAT